MNSLMTSGSGSRRSCLRNVPSRADQPRTTARASTASCGCSRRVRRGVICRIGTVPGRRSTVASAAGNRLVSGSASWPRCNTSRMQRASSTGPCTSSIRRWSGHTSMRLGQRGGPSDRGAWSQPGRVLHQGACAGRGFRQADHRRGDTRSAARPANGRTAVRTRRSPARWSRTTAHPAGAHRRRQGLQQSALAALSQATRHPADDPAAARPTPSWIVRPRCVPAAQPDRADDQPAQAVPAHCHPLRETRGHVSRHADRCRDTPMALTFADTP